MPNRQLLNTYTKVFGSGAPGALVPPDCLYYDSSTTPYTPYIYVSGTGWVTYSLPGGAINANQIQGIDVDATPPTNGQVLTYSAGGNKYVPA